MSLKQLNHLLVGAFLQVGLADHIDQVHVREVALDLFEDSPAELVVSLLEPQFSILLNVVGGLGYT